jgi:hypothetical protein
MAADPEGTHCHEMHLDVVAVTKMASAADESSMSVLIK